MIYYLYMKDKTPIILKELKALSKPTKAVVTKRKPKKQDKVKKRLYGKLRESKKQQLLLEAFDLYSKGMKTKEIASSLGVGYGTMFSLLTNEASFDYIKNVKSKTLAIQFLDDIALNRQAQAKLRDKASFSQLGTDIGIKWDKVHPPNTHTVHVGDKNLTITPPKYFRPRK